MRDDVLTYRSRAMFFGKLLPVSSTFTYLIHLHFLCLKYAVNYGTTYSAIYKLGRREASAG